MVGILIPGPEGKIEAKYIHNNNDKSPIILILHPDPSRGGTMNTKIGYKNPPVIIAEISGNHNGSKKRFLQLIKSACLNGADLIKIQTYEPIDITLKGKTKHFYIKDGIWKNKHLWNLYKKAANRGYN